MKFIILFLSLFLVGCNQSIKDSLTSIKGSNSSELDIVQNVDFQINRYKYIEDKVNYKAMDYFASYSNFKKNGGGDCEDFAIAKYTALTNEFGVDKSKLKFHLLKYKEIRKETIYHMVLAYNDGNTEYLLDNNRRTRAEKRLDKEKITSSFNWDDIEKYIDVVKNK